ncbi:hypothetical protein B0H13DRAFT_1861138 [Mycena leptocephala]|nr:hypothetical protein B0H13DRAFT_1861138 [Mycena leptocephala]
MGCGGCPELEAEAQSERGRANGDTRNRWMFGTSDMASFGAILAAGTILGVFGTLILRRIATNRAEDRGKCWATIDLRQHVPSQGFEWAAVKPKAAFVVLECGKTAGRCRSALHGAMQRLCSGVAPAQLRAQEVAVRNQEVKRVDFLLGKTVFKGLVWAEDPADGMQIITE